MPYVESGADDQDRTGDLVLTKDVLCQLSYIGQISASAGSGAIACSGGSLERETGIEPATNSLEGCDSTTELLPHVPFTSFARHARPTCATRGQPPSGARSLPESDGWWRGKDSNLRSRRGDRFTVCCV